MKFHTFPFHGQLIFAACNFLLFNEFFICLDSDVNECLEDPCGVNAVCVNSEGSFTCTCKNGFTRNGTKCLGKTAFFMK